MSATIATEAGAVLSRALRLERADFSSEVAQWLLAADFDTADRERIAELYARAREGTLSDAEDAELGMYGEIGRLLENWRVKAGASLSSSHNEKASAGPALPSRGSFVQRWTGKLALKEPDPHDPRLTHLLDRYERNRK